VIEGVMMRGPGHIACAVRRKDDSIDIYRNDFVSVTKNHPFYRQPIIRGFVSLIEMLKIGLQSLNFSAHRYELDYPEEQKDSKSPSETTKPKSDKRKKIEEAGTIIFAMVLAIALFGLLPYFLTSVLNIDKQNILFNLFAGCIRICFFVLYVYLISLMKDVKMVFEYHGAEHKAVSTHEKNQDLTIENVKEHSTIHQRCGTSFMFLVLLIAILLFSIIDTLITYHIGRPLAFWERFIYHLPFIPFISGIGYEIIKLSDKNKNHFLVRLFTAPGMALQRITTKEPSESQIEVAIIALKAALNEDLDRHTGINFVDYPNNKETQ